MAQHQHPNSTKNSITQPGGNLTDYAFRFPLENSFSKVEIPFSFQTNLNENSKADNFHSYIKIQETPTLFLDISNEENVDKLFLTSTIESLKSENKQNENKIANLESQITSTKNENESIKGEINRLKEELALRKNAIQSLNLKIQQSEDKFEKYLNDINSKLNEKLIIHNNLKEKYEQIEKIKNQKDSSNIDIINSAHQQFELFFKEYSNSLEYLKAKFTNDTHSDSYIQKSLQLDLLDYQAYVKEQLKAIKPKIAECIKLLQKSVNDSIGKDYEVKLYGSHATNLCLPWSDLDVVIVKNDNGQINSSHTLLAEFYKYLKDNEIFLVMNFISTTTVPLIKIQTGEEFNYISIDISLQSNIHYGIKCVGLVINFIKEYEVLVPMVLALKNILKKANLNNPYKGGISSYGLVLLIVYFLKNQIKEGKKINKTNDNLGRLFYEFLYFYGFQFDPSKYIIDTENDQENADFYMQQYHQNEIIIVDPLNPSNNVGKNTRQFNNIKLSFMIAFIVCKEFCECGCHFSPGNNNTFLSTDHCILNRIFNGVKRFSSDCVN